MFVIPAIDVLDGKVVRLRRGLREEATVYGELEGTIEAYQGAGVKRIHIVDLNATFGEPSDLLLRLKKYSGIRFQVGGGFRTIEKIQRTLQETNHELVVGSILTGGEAVRVHELTQQDKRRIIAALDVLPESESFIVKDNGWRRDTKKNIFEVIDDLREIPFKAFLVTDIARDGELSGPNFTLYSLLQERYPELHFIASGGVRSTSDLSSLAAEKIGSVVVGKALFEKKLSLAEVISWRL